MALALVVSLSACGDDGNGGSGMNGPTQDQSFSSRTLTADQDPVNVNLEDYFSGDRVSYEASSSNSEVVAASVDSGTLVLDPQGGGTSTVTVVAQNDAGEAQGSASVTVELPSAPGPPSE